MADSRTITSPDDEQLDALYRYLAREATVLDQSNAWPSQQLRQCADAGVFRWFLPRHLGGQEWSEADITRGYLALGASCLTTAFIITQRTGACQRIAASENEEVKQRLLPDLASGASFATVGISHLTTSRRHLGRPALAARETPQGFVLDGFTPWVTGAAHAQTIVVGAELPDTRQILLALPTDLSGVQVADPLQLVGLSASHTGEVHFEQVQVDRQWLLAGPSENVMKSGSGAGTGGLQTSTLAIGMTGAAIDYLEGEVAQRADLAEPAAELRREHVQLQTRLLSLADGQRVCTNDEMRAAANSLVLRATQAALAAAKGTGYVVGHPAGRWCREALFFLVWSCTQGVLAANLCELAGLE